MVIAVVTGIKNSEFTFDEAILIQPGTNGCESLSYFIHISQT